MTPTRRALPPAEDADLRLRFGLTEAEARIARAIAAGLSYSEIAARLGVSYHTAHSHIKAIHRKAGVRSNARLVALMADLEKEKR